MAAAVTLCTFLATFIILAMTLAAAIVGPQFLTAEAHLPCNTVASLVAAQGGPSGVPCPKDALHLYKVSQVLGAIALACLFFGYVFNSLGLADMESDSVRDTVVKSRSGYLNPQSGYAEVINPPLQFYLGVLFTAAGVMTVLAAVSSAMASSVTKHDWAFKTVVIVLGFAAIFGTLIMFLSFVFRRETPVTQAEYQNYNGNVVNGIPLQTAPMNAAP